MHRFDVFFKKIIPNSSLFISIFSGPVCKYLLTASDKDTVPFDVQVIDQFTGAAVIRVKVGIIH
ncbi:unnamed protein product [Nippostrongylus brasiliensis]|uniref:Uncharacterized protein n=1 Tax=Nippostrongylus brasiliensis TaxID=27835 RepID=A0A0N4XNZ8_NIPBR|nr:unnamed protein product [Nippostrongylus brasiliensis]